MNVSLYQAAAAMNANAPWQEVISENLAGASIPGARKQEVSFSAVSAGKAPGLAGLSGGNYVMAPATTAVNFEQGTLRPTGLPTDLAIEGPGFFEVQLPNGRGALPKLIWPQPSDLLLRTATTPHELSARSFHRSPAGRTQAIRRNACAA